MFETGARCIIIYLLFGLMLFLYIYPRLKNMLYEYDMRLCVIIAMLFWPIWLYGAAKGWGRK